MTSEVTQAALEPCPFCGDVAYLDAAEVDDLSLEPEDREVVAWSVGCSCCAFHGPHSTEESAIAAWNTRLTAQSGEGRSGAGEDALATELAKLKASYERALSQADGADHKLIIIGNYGDLALQAIPRILAALNARQSGEGERDQ